MEKTRKPQIEAALLEYGILEENGVYGIRIDATTKQSTASKTVHGITSDLTRAIDLMGLLWRRGVSPVNLEDVLTDLGVISSG